MTANFVKSSIGKKIIVALTGLILFGFLIGHLLGNLQVFLGPEVFNHYAEFLKKTKGLLWGTRIVLTVSVFLHVLLTLQLTQRNRQSRPHPYRSYSFKEASPVARTMIWGGIFLALFIVYHLLHLTVGVVHPHFDTHDVYRNVLSGLSIWYVALFYIMGMIALGFHLFHGAWSFFQTLGLNHPKYNGARRIFAVTAAVLISGGFITIPVSILLGVLH